LHRCKDDCFGSVDQGLQLLDHTLLLPLIDPKRSLGVSRERERREREREERERERERVYIYYIHIFIIVTFQIIYMIVDFYSVTTIECVHQGDFCDSPIDAIPAS